MIRISNAHRDLIVAALDRYAARRPESLQEENLQRRAKIVARKLRNKRPE